MKLTQKEIYNMIEESKRPYLRREEDRYILLGRIVLGLALAFIVFYYFTMFGVTAR